MCALGATSQATDDWSCAEPSCPNEVEPRRGGQTFFLHCERHRNVYAGLPQDWPAPPTVWGRYTCSNCGAVFEKYKNSVRGTTDRVFCGTACRNEMGSKPRTIPEKLCEWCNEWFRPRTRTIERRFCDQACYDEYTASLTRTRPRPTRNNAADLVEVRYCEQPGCDEQLPPRDPTNSYRVKRCGQHRHSGHGRGRRRDPSKMVELTCYTCGTSFWRYRTSIAKNTTGRYFCSQQCKSTTGSRPNKQDWYTCEYCDELFRGKPSCLNRFCSTKCKKLGTRKQVERTCIGCGVVFSKPECDRDVYCTRACFDKYNVTPDGKRQMNYDGYVLIYVPGHREAHASGWGLEHRVVMSDHLGRKLAEGSSVHHKNKIKSDNRLSNLEYWLGNHGAGARLDDVVEHLLNELEASDPRKAAELRVVYSGQLPPV